MDRNSAIYLFIGVLLGAMIGTAWGAASGNPYPWMGFGALGGLFVGWFIAAAVLNRGK